MVDLDDHRQNLTAAILFPARLEPTASTHSLSPPALIVMRAQSSQACGSAGLRFNAEVTQVPFVLDKIGYIQSNSRLEFCFDIQICLIGSDQKRPNASKCVQKRPNGPVSIWSD
jgi:hypothetical protein